MNNTDPGSLPLLPPPPSTLLPPPPEIVYLERVLADTRAYLTALAAVYYWEWIVTLPKEYQRMWKAERWTPVRVVFFFNRYWGLGMATLFMVTFWSVIPAERCGKIHYIQPVWALLLIWSNEFLLGARVYAIWNQNIWVGLGLIFLSLGGGALKIFIFAQDQPLGIPDGFGLRGCISNGAVSYIWVHWAIPLFYDTVVFTLTLIPLAKYWKLSGSTPLIEAFIRDGAFFFAISIIANLINVVYFLLPNVTNNAFHVPLAILVPAIMASRVVLNLRSPTITMYHSSSNPKRVVAAVSSTVLSGANADGLRNSSFRLKGVQKSQKTSSNEESEGREQEDVMVKLEESLGSGGDDKRRRFSEQPYPA